MKAHVARLRATKFQRPGVTGGSCIVQTVEDEPALGCSDTPAPSLRDKRLGATKIRRPGVTGSSAFSQAAWGYPAPERRAEPLRESAGWSAMLDQNSKARRDWRQLHCPSRGGRTSTWILRHASAIIARQAARCDQSSQARCDWRQLHCPSRGGRTSTWILRHASAIIARKAERCDQNSQARVTGSSAFSQAA